MVIFIQTEQMVREIASGCLDPALPDTPHQGEEEEEEGSQRKRWSEDGGEEGCMSNMQGGGKARVRLSGTEMPH